MATLGIMITALGLSACAKHTVVPLSEAKPGQRGVIYALPRGVVEVEIGLTKKSYKAGDFTRVLLSLPQSKPADEWQTQYLQEAKKFFARRYDAQPKPTPMPGGVWDTVLSDEGNEYYLKELRAKLAEEDIALALGPDTISISELAILSKTEPDPDRLYAVKVKGGFLVDRTVSMSLSESGLLQEGSSEVVNQTVNVILEVIKVAAEVVVGGLGRSKAGGPDVVASDAPTPDQADLNQWAQSLRYQGLQIAIGRAEQIENLVTQRNNVFSFLVAGRIDADAAERLIQQYESELDRLRSYFNPMPNTQAATAVLRVIPPTTTMPDTAGAAAPNSDAFTSATTFVGLNKSGTRLFVDPGLKGQLPGDWPITEIDKNDAVQTTKLGQGTRFILELERLRNGMDDEIFAKMGTEAESGAFNTPSGKQGYYYLVPGRIGIRIKKEKSSVSTLLEHLEGPMPQFGPLLAMPEHTNSISSTYTLKMHSDLGSLQSVKVVTKGAELDQVQALGNAVTAIDQADDNAELAELERELKYLETVDKIEELKAKRAESTP